MMKMTILAPRRIGMTHVEFRTYLTEVHGPLVASITEVAADIRHYHYNFPIIGATDPFGHPIAGLDVLTQGYFDSREAQLENMKHPRFMEFLRPDEANFADTSRALMHYTDEHEVTGGPRTATKIFSLRRRSPHLDRSEFQRRWLEAFPAVLRSRPELDGLITRYVQNHVQAEELHPDGTEAKFYDVIDEMWVSDLDAVHAACSLDTLAAIDTVERELLDVSRTRAFPATMVASIP